MYKKTKVDLLLYRQAVGRIRSGPAGKRPLAPYPAPYTYGGLTQNFQEI